jgi:hypothetical protein
MTTDILKDMQQVSSIVFQFITGAFVISEDVWEIMQNNYLLEYCVLERIALTLFNKSLLLK